MIDIDTLAPQRPDPWRYARTIFGRLLVAGAIVMMVMGVTDYRAGLLTPFDMVMLPVLTTVTLVVAVIVILDAPRLRLAVGFNGFVLWLYYEGALVLAVQSRDPVSAYSMASTAQFLPGFYIALFVLLRRHAATFAWLIYAGVAAVCGYGLWLGDPQAVQRQMYWAILAAHPCCILVLSFMTHLRDLIESSQQASISAKERFLAVVSHEVRSPLQTIVSSLELVESANPGPIAQRAMGRIKSASHVLETQIRDLTAFTRLELAPDQQVADVQAADILAQVHQVYLDQARRRGLNLCLALPQTAHTYRADGARLRQILENLVGNALKYTASGSVTLGGEHEASGHLHLWVQDTGRGMPAERVRQVFEPFVRIKAFPEERIEGSGLGLAVVRQLVGLMKGRIQVDTAPGKGTTVHIRLPLPRVPGQTAPEAAPLPGTVLVVDDDVDIRHAIADLLRECGVARVLVAADGQAAMALLQQQAVDVGLIDLQLPGASGYDIAQATRRLGANQITPLIAVSAIALDPREPGAEAFDEHLSKPVTRAKLVAAMARATRARHAAQA